MASRLGTTVGYLLGENDTSNLLKDPDMVNRFRDILALQDKEREHVLFALDTMIQNVKLRALTAA